MKNYLHELEKYITEEINILNNINLESINNVMNIFEICREAGNNIFICGNGGSASTASHFCCDFNKGVSLTQKKKYNFECLNDNVPTMMAIANDIGYDQIFCIPLKNKIKPGDIFVGISGSGNSINVIKAMKYAKTIDAITIALVGYDGGEMLKIADHSIHIPINNMQIVEDIHMILDHIIMYVLCHSLESDI